MSSHVATPGVVLLGSDFKALGVARSLGRRGIPIVVLDNVPRSAWFSRYVIKRVHWHGPLDGRPLVDLLLELALRDHLEQWILFPVQDDAVEFVARNTHALTGLYRMATQDWNVIRWAADKRLTHRMAHQVGVPYPTTWYPTCEDDLKTMDIGFPAILKPARSICFQHALRLKALPADTQETLVGQYRLAAQMIDPDEIMVQEVIPGDGHAQFSVAAYSHEGRMLLAMSARRTRQYPIDYGLSSTFVEAIEVPELFQPTERLLGILGISGMVEVEFKYDARDGQYKLLDINVRPWSWHTLCIASGLDFPYIHYCDLLGHPIPTAVPAYGYRWIRALTDIPAGWLEARAGIASPWSYLRSLVGPTVFSVFDVRDPLPALGDIAVAFCRLARSHRTAGLQRAHHLLVGDGAVKRQSYPSEDKCATQMPEYETDRMGLRGRPQQ
ncbi:MAG TPA: ATP-grasp domain-containing protein [Ktedonobacterales bacterium]